MSGATEDPWQCERTPWRSGFPDVFVHADWRGGSVSLAEQSRYRAAKKFGDAHAAREIVEFLLNDESVYAVGDMVNPSNISNTYVVAPARTYMSPANALPHVFAFVIANELSLPVCMSIYQYDGIKRDQRGFWQRFANPVSFRGNIPKRADFILVDDVVTTGGTLAALRGLIEKQGGNVICMTALSSPGGTNVKLALDPGTCNRLKSAHEGRLARLIKSETHYAIEHLTEPEATKLLAARSPHEVRQAIARARHEGNVGKGKGGDGRPDPSVRLSPGEDASDGLILPADLPEPDASPQTPT